MIRIVEKCPQARGLRYRARMAVYLTAEKCGRHMRRVGARMSWWGGEQAHALSTGRVPRR